jgi:hypothetical protein
VANKSLSVSHAELGVQNPDLFGRVSDIDLKQAVPVGYNVLTFKGLRHMDAQVNGVVVKQGDIKNPDKTYRQRPIVVMADDGVAYCIDLVGEMSSNVFEKDQRISIGFSLAANEVTGEGKWKGHWFNNVVATSIDVDAASPSF